MAKEFDSLVGNKYGEWEVIEHKTAGKCICRCSCGTIREVLRKSLLRGASKSCGHKTNQLKDMSGQKFGEWTVLGYAGDSKWVCQCSCGKRAIVHGYDLRDGNSTSCGHVGHPELSLRNSENRQRLEGMQFSDWTVLEYVGDKQYRCRCSCGKEKIVSSARLLDGGSKSCGHNNSKSLLDDLTGKIFGDLTVLEYIGHKHYKCECSCGNITIVTRGNLRSGDTKSCGCKKSTILTKEYLINVIEEIKEETGYAPFINEIAFKLGRNAGDIARRIREHGLSNLLNREFGSSIEKELYGLFPGAIVHDRTILNGNELDLYYSDAKVAIEINGDYWHSTLYKSEKYHQNKTLECAKHGIRLIHVFEHEWMESSTKKKIIALINEALNGKNRVEYARNTAVKLITHDTAREFLDRYHIQNYAASRVQLGCYLEDELLGVMTFGTPRFNTNYEWEIIRLCWKEGLTVVGGTEKMFKHFTNKYNPLNIITYADISKFTGNIYTRLGFTTDLSCITSPNYIWINLNTWDKLTRSYTQKHKLVKNGLGSENETEDEIMYRLGYYKIYDSGNLRMSWVNN